MVKLVKNDTNPITYTITDVSVLELADIQLSLVTNNRPTLDTEYVRGAQERERELATMHPKNRNAILDAYKEAQ
jgi:hypothetical protein